MRTLLAITLVLGSLAPRGLPAQAPGPGADPLHVAVEVTTLVLDGERVRRLGLDGVVLSSGGAAVGAAGGSTGAVRVGSRVGGLEVSAWLDLVRSRRAVRRESTQRVVALSGSAARLSSGQTLSGPYGQSASAGPELWVEPVVLEDGRVRLRLWTAVGEVRAGPFGSVWREVPVEASTELVVPDGAPVLIASTEHAEERSHRGLLARGSADAATRAWIVLTPRVVHDPAREFEIPEGIPAEWVRR
jgi:hypothetical protein